MPSFERIHSVNYSADNMYALVADVESYPEFLPLCERLSVQSRREKKGRELLMASMTVGFKNIRETFLTKVMLHKGARQIEAQYIDGPFKYLNNRWQFKEKGANSCDIIFFIDYEFKSKVLGALMGGMFDRAFNKYVEAFEARAAVVYDGSSA